MIRLDVDVNVPRIATKQYKLSQKDVDRYIKKSLNESCRLIRDYARTHHRYEDDLERAKAKNLIGLTRAIMFKPVKLGERVGKVYIDEKEAPYAKYQVRGTKAHSVEPPKVMKWFSNRYGKWFRRHKVRGIVKDSFIKKAYINTKLDVKDIFRINLRRLLDGKL